MNPYEDMLYLPHPVSTKHPQMSLQERAAQFAPFAALTGYEDITQETRRLTHEEILLDESYKAELNDRLMELLQNPDCVALFTYFEADKRKEGGSYHTIQARIVDYDSCEQRLRLEPALELKIEQIKDIQIDKTAYFQNPADSI